MILHDSANIFNRFDYICGDKPTVEDSQFVIRSPSRFVKDYNKMNLSKEVCK